MTAKTVKVRIAVAVDANGEWNSCGWQVKKPENQAKDEREMFSLAAEVLDPGEARYWIEAELPVPEAQTVQGTVTPVGSVKTGGFSPITGGAL